MDPTDPPQELRRGTRASTSPYRDLGPARQSAPAPQLSPINEDPSATPAPKARRGRPPKSGAGKPPRKGSFQRGKGKAKAQATDDEGTDQQTTDQDTDMHETAAETDTNDAEGDTALKDAGEGADGSAPKDTNKGVESSSSSGKSVATPPLNPTTRKTPAKMAKTPAPAKNLPFDDQSCEGSGDSEDIHHRPSMRKGTPAAKQKSAAIGAKASAKGKERAEDPEKPEPKSSKKRKTPFEDRAYRDEGGPDADDEDEEPIPTPTKKKPTPPLRPPYGNQGIRGLAARRAHDFLPSTGAGSSSRPLASGSSGPLASSTKRPRTTGPTIPAPSGAGSATDDDGLGIEDADLFLHEIMLEPRALGLDEICALFVRLQHKTFQFAQRNFDFSLTGEQETAWPMHLLSTKYLSLMLITQKIGDGSQHGWRNFFTKPEHRVPLVYGILGEWFNHRIFKHTAFSIRDGKLDELEAIDRQYLYYDAIVRTKKRAACLEGLRALQYFDTHENKSQHTHNVDHASRQLARQIVDVLQPLFPPPIFDPILSRGRLSGEDRARAADQENEIYFQLLDLIKMATGLHLAIRFTGVNGTIVRIAPHVQKGSPYNPEADNICVNSGWMNETRFSQPGQPFEPQVKMTCWGGVEAVVPHGPDRLELEQKHRGLTQKLEKGEKLDWEKVEEEIFVKYPYDLQETEAGKAAVEDDRPPPGTEWNIAMAKVGLRQSNIRDYPRDLGPADGLDEPEERPDDEDSDQPQKQVGRGSYVTVYPRVAPSNVYCEWVAREPQQQRRQTLEEAVMEARKAKLLYRIQAIGIEAVNQILTYPAGPWLEAACIAAGLLPLINVAYQSIPWSDVAHDTWSSYTHLQKGIQHGMAIVTNGTVAKSEYLASLGGNLTLPFWAAPLASTTTLTETVTEMVTNWMTSTVYKEHDPPPLRTRVVTVVGEVSYDEDNVWVRERYLPGDPGWDEASELADRILAVQDGSTPPQDEGVTTSSPGFSQPRNVPPAPGPDHSRDSQQKRLRPLHDSPLTAVPPTTLSDSQPYRVKDPEQMQQQRAQERKAEEAPARARAEIERAKQREEAKRAQIRERQRKAKKAQKERADREYEWKYKNARDHSERLNVKREAQNRWKREKKEDYEDRKKHGEMTWRDWLDRPLDRAYDVVMGNGG